MKELKTRFPDEKLNMEELKTKRIIFKLTELQCPLFGGDKQNCLREILFKPSFERYTLLEWCLRRLGVTIGEKEQFSSLDGKVQSFLDLLSSLGLCTKNDADLIQGTAPLSKQLTFWDLLSGILSENEVIANTDKRSFDATASPTFDLTTVCFEHNKSDYEQSCDYISNVCNSVPLNTLYDRKLQLFPAYLRKEISQAFLKENSSLSKEDIKKVFLTKICDSEKYVSADYSVGEKRFEIKESNDDIIPNEDNLVKTEDLISESLNTLQDLNFSFNSVYNDLKPYLPDVPSNDFVDIGPVFKTGAEKLQSMLQLRCSSNDLKSADTDLQDMSTDISSITLSSEKLSNTKLEEYITIFSDMNIER